MHPGELVAGRFEIEAVAGTGGMGTVYRARDLASGQIVALKALTSVGEHDAVRFSREAAVLAELVHPGIVRYVAHGMSAHHEPYIVMEWLDGETLHARLARGLLAVDDAVTLVRAAAEALAVAHGRGVVHRDLKPMNMILVGGELARVKLLDFGIARHIEHAGRITHTGMLLGTPGYMAPEQVRGDSALDPRTDVFALGCVLYRCLTGVSAFGGDQSLAVLAKILVEEVAPPSTIVPGIPPAIDALVLRMLAKQPADRPTGAAEVARLLGGFADATLRDTTPHDVTLRAVVPGPGATVMTDETRSPGSGQVLTGSEQRLVSLVLSASGEQAIEHARLTATATAFGGRVERISDGTSLVLFAYGGGASDHAMRAARFALAIRDAFPAAPLVVASGRAAVDRLPVGDVIDRAVAALRDTAASQIALDDTTAGLLDERFVVTEHGDARRFLRGMRDGSEPARTLLGRTTPMVGRDRELAMLESLWAECVHERVARVVLVTAGPGAGKSRLRHELVRRVLQGDGPAELLIGRGDALRAGSPFAMLADAIRRSAGVREGDDPDEQRAGLLARMQRCLPPSDGERVAHLLGELAGVAFPSDASEALLAARADPVVKMDAMREAWIDWLAAECRRHPVFIVLEDLHWGDRATIDYLDTALRELAQAPLLVLALARPEIHDQFPRLWADRELAEIRLPALTRKAGERLVRALLGDELSADVVLRIVERSAGNAFFLEELIRAVAEGREQALPDSVLAILQVRLDQLGPEPKRVLRAASVFGTTFWRGGIAALLGQDARAHVATLVERELVAVQHESRLPGELEYAFRHNLIREAAYETMGEADRALGHRLAGDWLATRDFADALALAEHFSRGGDPARAAEYYARAAEQALAGNDDAAAIAHADRGLGCGATGELAGRLQLVRAEAFNWRGEYGATSDAAAAAIAHLPRGGSGWFRAQDELFFAVSRLGRIPNAITIVRDLTATEALPEARKDQLRSIARAAIMMYRFGPPEVGGMLAKRIEELAGQITIDLSTEQRLLSLRGLEARARGEVDAAIAAHVDAIRGCETTHNVRELAFTYLSYGNIYHEIGQPQLAVPLLERGLQIAERAGASTAATLLHFSLGVTLWHCDRWDDARAHSERALAGCGEHDRVVAALARFALANIALAVNDLDEAHRQSEDAIALLTAFPEYRSFALATSARVRLRLGDPGGAVELATQARQTFKPQNGFQEGESLIRLVEIEALEAAGQLEAAREATAIAIARIEARAARIEERWRSSWVSRPENAQTLARRVGATEIAGTG